MKAQLISLSQAARLTGKSRSTLIQAARGLKWSRGPKNAKQYDANALLMSLYCGNHRALSWEQDRDMWDLLAKELDRHA